jgi:hypothetical protein
MPRPRESVSIRPHALHRATLAARGSSRRADSFWRWFQTVAPRFYDTIEAGRCSSLTGETSAKVDEILPGFAWVFGPGENGRGHSFTLTGEGIIHRQLLTLHWLSRAPVIDNWTFYAARQPGPIKGHVIEMDGLRFDPKEIWVTPAIAAEDENIDITVWHPAWETIDRGRQSTVTFLFLDEALGEYGTDWWIGQVEFGDGKLAGAIPVEELAEYVGATSKARGWKKHSPGELWTLFETQKSSDNFPRADIITQNTCVPKLFTNFMNAAGDYEDPLTGTGADYVYVSVDSSFFPKGQEVSGRGEIEDAIEKALTAFNGGRCVGGALGRERCYSDFLLFDGERSLNAIRYVLREQKVPPGTMIEFFAREKRGQRIAL